MTSHRRPLARLSATAVITALMLGGCAFDGIAKPSRIAAAPLKASGGKAVSRAERKVLAAPRDAAARAALGAAYLEAGRFASAVEAYDAALELGDESAATVLGLALAETAQGNNPAALELLNDWRDVIPARDLGLAVALAGETSRGVAILVEALRAGDVSANLRQNLAFAYALDGRWMEARLTAAQDLPADQVDARISEWAQLARAENVRGRVAHLLAVPLVEDPGQPVALALAETAGEALAAAEPAPQPQAEPAPAPVVVAATAVVEPTPAPVELPALGEVPAPPPLLASAEPAPAPITLAAFDPPAALVASDTPTLAAAPPPQPAVKPRIVGSYVPRGPVKASAAYVPQGQPAKQPGQRSRPVVKPAAPKVAAGGSHWVQLGSYTDPAVAAEGWRKFTSRTPGLKPFRATTTTAVVDGTKVWRVAAAGFASYADAKQMCRTVRGRGGACLVVSAPMNPTGSAFASLKR